MTPLKEKQIADIKDRIINPLTIIMLLIKESNHSAEVKTQIKKITKYLDELQKKAIN